MIKRYHEAPKAIFNRVQQHTDGDYALVHLFETDQEYFNMFKQAVADGRDIILDNSIFELGESFDHDRYAYWINQLKPTWYIVPDVWKNGPATAKMFEEFFSKHPKESLHGKVIGVAQGYTPEEVAECYRAIEPYCDMIAFNLDFATQADVPEYGIPYCLRMSLGRRRVLGILLDTGVINESKPHHLLGCGVPQEVVWYPKSWTWVRSVDTCNPVLHGMLGHRYSLNLPGMSYKVTDPKMCECMDYSISEEQWRDIRFNLTQIECYEDLRGE